MKAKPTKKKAKPSPEQRKRWSRLRQLEDEVMELRQLVNEKRVICEAWPYEDRVGKHKCQNTAEFKVLDLKHSKLYCRPHAEHLDKALRPFGFAGMQQVEFEMLATGEKVTFG